VSASPGFSWGANGNQGAGTYLQNDGVPSNRSGKIVPLVNGTITNVFVTSENVDTFDICIQSRVGAVFTDILTVSLVAQRDKTATAAVAVTLGEELCCYVKSGSCKNPDVGIIIKGTIV
jgi:hypothetical protein